MGEVCDFYRAKAKRLINQVLGEYGSLPGFLLHELIHIRVCSERKSLDMWTTMSQGVVDPKLLGIYNKWIVEAQGLIAALDLMVEEYKISHDNEIPYSRI